MLSLPVTMEYAPPRFEADYGKWKEPNKNK